MPREPVCSWLKDDIRLLYLAALVWAKDGVAVRDSLRSDVSR
jgi:hypothetical protein